MADNLIFQNDLGPITAYAIAVAHGFDGTEEEWLDQKCHPKRGRDYWTEEDIQSIEAYIDTQLGVIANGTY